MARDRKKDSYDAYEEDGEEIFYVVVIHSLVEFFFYEIVSCSLVIMRR